MAMKVQRAEFKNTPKIKVKKQNKKNNDAAGWNFIAVTQNGTQQFV